MARVILDLPDEFTFSTQMDIRVTEINYGNHVGNDRMVSLLHEARLRFLRSQGFDEFNVGGVGLIVTDLVVRFKAESFVGDMLTFHVGATDFNKYGCDIIYKAENEAQDKLVVQAKTGIVFFDYDERKVVNVPKVFYQHFAPHLLEEASEA